MKRILILGAGTAGTMMANHLDRVIDKKNWRISVVEKHRTHYYQPGFLFIPFGIYGEKDVVRVGKFLLPRDIELFDEEAERIDHGGSAVWLKSGAKVDYDILIIATGTRTAPEETEGLSGSGWRKNIFDFYTLEGAVALAEKMKDWQGGRFVVHLTEMPVKCPVAPLEFTFLSDWFFSKKRLRDKVEITYVTPLPGAFTKKETSEVLGHLLTDKKINMVTDFDVEKVDASTNTLSSFGGVDVPYDLLVTVPTNKGDDLIARSGMGNELNYVPTDKNTLQSKKCENIFVIGDATDLPSSKAGSVAHFQSEVLTHNILSYMKHKPLDPGFDGHANCFIESGYGKAFLIDFNYDTEPVRGEFPLPFVGPFKLLKETRINHLGKMAFHWIYWNMLVKGIAIPGITTQMSKVGKKINS